MEIPVLAKGEGNGTTIAVTARETPDKGNIAGKKVSPDAHFAA